MLTLSALALVVSLAQTPAAPPATTEPLDSRWIKGIGTVSLSTPGGNRLRIEIRDEAGSTSARTLELDPLDPKAVVVEAHSASFLAGQGLVVGLAENLSVLLIPASYKSAVPFIILLLVLYFRPQGLLGTEQNR